MNYQSPLEEDGMHATISKPKINISRLKKFAFNKLPKDWPLREILLSENDELDVSVFLARLPVWLKLSKFSVGEDQKYTF